MCLFGWGHWRSQGLPGEEWKKIIEEWGNVPLLPTRGWESGYAPGYGCGCPIHCSMIFLLVFLYDLRPFQCYVCPEFFSSFLCQLGKAPIALSHGISVKLSAWIFVLYTCNVLIVGWGRDWWFFSVCFSLPPTSPKYRAIKMEKQKKKKSSRLLSHHRWKLEKSPIFCRNCECVYFFRKLSYW